METHNSQFINEQEIERILEISQYPDPSKVRDVLSKAKEMKGLDLEEVAVLTNISDSMQLFELFETANHIKEKIYGKRLVIYAPLQISNDCSSECSYCSMRVNNEALVRYTLTQAEIVAKTEILIKEGHKRVLLISSDLNPNRPIQYLLDSIASAYKAKVGNGEIRRVNVNMAPMETAEYELLVQAKIGTYQLFQETYHPKTYREVHLEGRKKDYTYRLTALHRAMEAGIKNVGTGVLFGLYNFRFEMLALMQHIRELEKVFGMGPHTISVRRIEPAQGASMAFPPPFSVSDLNYRKIIAILRLAVPYTGIVMSNRESASMRRETIALGVSQISAGSHTASDRIVLGLKKAKGNDSTLGDTRSLDEVVRDVAEMGYIPSFCNSCHRLGRTGLDFMDMAKPGNIKSHCNPNAISTFMEYLMDYASYETRLIGEDLIDDVIDSMEGLARERALILLEKVKKGKRDIYC